MKSFLITNHSMRNFLILILIGISISANGQKKKSGTFDIEDFNRKMEDVEWLIKYDMVAWKTSDSAMAQNPKEVEMLGSEWFCFKENNLWHAVFGKYQDNNFDMVFHFVMDNKGVVKRTSDKVDTLLSNTFSRALITAQGKLSSSNAKANISFNQYIRKNSDNTITVWILPAFQPSKVAVYGGEFIYQIDSTGNNILKDDSYFTGQYQGFEVDNPGEVWLDYSQTDKPTLGGIFFAYYYKSYFPSIILDTQKSQSTLMQRENDKAYYWVHAEKKPKKK